MTGYSTPIHEQPLAIREAIIQSWRVSYLSPLNAVYKSLVQAGKNLWIKTSPTFRQVTGFTLPEHERGAHYRYTFDQFSAGEEPEVIETDVIIVGSGCGGAVCAKNLAEAGHKVLVVEKGYYYSTDNLPMDESEAMERLFDNGAVTMTDDGSMTVSGSKLIFMKNTNKA